MAGIWEAIREFLARLFGGNDSKRRLKALDAMEEKLVSTRRDNEDALQAMNADIASLEARARRKNKELAETSGERKRFVVADIEDVFRDIDAKKGTETILRRNLEVIRTGLAKVAEARAALKRGVTSDEFDVLALELQDLIGELRDTDAAERQLKRDTKYEPPQADRMDVNQRMAEVQTAEKAPETLSPETQKRLKQLEIEES